MVSAAHLPGYRSYDGLFGLDIESEVDVDWCSGTVRYLRSVYDCSWMGIRPDAGCRHRYYRWCGWSDCYLPFFQTGTEPDGSHCGICILLHGTGTCDTAAYHASVDYKEGKIDSYEGSACRIAYRKGNVPDCRIVADLFPGSFRSAFVGNAVLR